MKERQSFHFLGVDSAPAQKPSADDGALVGLRALVRAGDEHLAQAVQPEDWTLFACYARKLRQAAATDWAARIHDLDARFNYARIMMDPGAGGGGGLIRMELRKERLDVDGAMQTVTPIVLRNDPGGGPSAKRKLTMFGRSDLGIETLWPKLAGDDVLIHTAHTHLRNALGAGQVVLPKAASEWRREALEGWAEERQWALRCLTEMAEQLQAITVLTDADGTQIMTTHNVPKFAAAGGRKDLAMALLYAYVAFLSWLRDAARWGTLHSHDAGGGRAVCATW